MTSGVASVDCVGVDSGDVTDVASVGRSDSVGRLGCEEVLSVSSSVAAVETVELLSGDVAVESLLGSPTLAVELMFVLKEGSFVLSVSIVVAFVVSGVTCMSPGGVSAAEEELQSNS